MYSPDFTSHFPLKWTKIVHCSAWIGSWLHTFISESITKSNVSSNSATGLGGGVYSYSDYSYIGDSAAISSVIVTNSTIGNNTATSGGGIYSESAFSKAKSLVQINKSTRFANIASAGAGGGI